MVGRVLANALSRLSPQALILMVLMTVPSIAVSDPALAGAGIYRASKRVLIFSSCVLSGNVNFDQVVQINLEPRPNHLVRQISNQSLPYGGLIHFSQESLGQRYQFYIIIIISFAVIGLIAGLLVSRARHRQAERALRESQALLGRIIGSAREAIISLDESEHIVLFNRAAEDMFRCSAQDVTGQPFKRFVTGDFLSENRQKLEGVGTKQAKGVLRSLNALRADGEAFPAEASISETELNGRKSYTIILRDITARLKAQATLSESEANYRAICNGVNDAISILSKENGVILEVNQRMCEMYGLTAEEAKNLFINDLSANEPPYTHEALLERIINASGGEPQFFEWRAKNKAGHVFWVEMSLRVITLQGTERLLAMVHDNSIRKQAEEALQETFAQVSKLKGQLEAENIYLREEIRLDHNFDEIIGESDAIKTVFLKIGQVAPADTTVLIVGETGAGKELVARAVHGMSQRKDKPLVKVNCAALPAALIESELFGHERGAFTTAVARRQGRFELANGGTLFLDEIGDLPLELQGKLLRALQDGEFERLGSSKTIKVNVRIIAATNRDLNSAVQKGQFREDLWYRLNVFPIVVPPLRERKQDIPLLTDAFVRKFSVGMGKVIDAITPATRNALRDYSWPGNVRELANVIERAVINTDGPTLRLADSLTGPEAIEIPGARQTLEDMERQYILAILEETRWRIEGPSGAARILAIHPSTLRTRMAKLGIQKPTAAI